MMHKKYLYTAIKMPPTIKNFCTETNGFIFDAQNLTGWKNFYLNYTKIFRHKRIRQVPLKYYLTRSVEFNKAVPGIAIELGVSVDTRIVAVNTVH